MYVSRDSTLMHSGSVGIYPPKKDQWDCYIYDLLIYYHNQPNVGKYPIYAWTYHEN